LNISNFIFNLKNNYGILYLEIKNIFNSYLNTR
jgi:hypothetical protein